MSMPIGSLWYDGATLVRTTSKARSVAGGSVVDVERVQDTTAKNMVLADGSIHPAGRAGFRWTAVVGNLRSAS